MKQYIKILLLVPILIYTSCKSDFLEEKPLDFLGEANALVTYSDFKYSIHELYNRVRHEFYSRGDRNTMDFIYGTDLVFDGQPDPLRFSTYPVAMSPVGDQSIAAVHWELYYQIISQANIILSRLDQAEMTDSQKALIEAEAKFFRGFSYRSLAYLYGGVPLVLEALTEPKFDFTRATKEAVLEQVIDDLKFATVNLPAKSDVQPGEIHQLAANHLLSEVYLAVRQYQNAVDAASIVIDDPGTALMTQRFGSRVTVTPGDVYWDLFQRGNQNLTTNTEALWVIQFETDIPGGGATTTTRVGVPLYERHHGPSVRDIRVNGGSPFLWPVGDYTGGRGIGWAISTKYFSNTIWEEDWSNDIRNANHNFVRKFVATNPASPLYGTVISTENPPAGLTVPSRAFYAYQSKVTTPFDHPENLYRNRPTWLLNETAGGTYTDQYMFRLAETYLLRAEAYLGLGNPGAAGADINVVRARANSNPITAADVDIDFILDERMREFGVEEKRRFTLMRLGLLYDRVKRYNPYYKEIQPHHNLFPIPYREIERNREAVMEQNPGY